MVEEAPSEATPLVNTTRGRDFWRISADRTSSAQSRTVDILKRARTRLRPDDSDTNSGIDKVCKEIEESEKKSNRFFWVACFFIVNHILGGAITLHFLEGWTFYDCFYFCIVTTTTVGYGDITPDSTLSKLYVIYYVVVSIALISAMLSYLIGLLLDQQEEFLLAAIVKDNQAEEQTEEEMEEYRADMEEQRSAESVSERIMNATRSLDASDYYGLGFSVCFLSVVLLAGYLIFAKLEKLSVVDSLYATIISATTVGFGDFEPTHNSTKAIMTLWLCFSTIAVGKLVADFTDANVKAKQRDVSRRLLTASMDVESIQFMDVDRSGSVDKCEFVTEMLIRSGKVERKDVDTILLRFKQLDTNSSGDLTVSDLEKAL